MNPESGLDITSPTSKSEPDPITTLPCSYKVKNMAPLFTLVIHGEKSWVLTVILESMAESVPTLRKTLSKAADSPGLGIGDYYGLVLCEWKSSKEKIKCNQVSLYGPARCLWPGNIQLESKIHIHEQNPVRRSKLFLDKPYVTVFSILIDLEVSNSHRSTHCPDHCWEGRA